MVVQGLDHLEALVPTLAGASDRPHARRCMMKQRPLPHQFKASRARTDRGTLDGLLRQTQALSRGAAAIRPFTSDSSSSPDARDQHARPRLSRTCKNSSGRRWKGARRRTPAAIGIGGINPSAPVQVTPVVILAALLGVRRACVPGDRNHSCRQCGQMPESFGIFIIIGESRVRTGQRECQSHQSAWHRLLY